MFLCRLKIREIVTFETFMPFVKSYIEIHLSFPEFLLNMCVSAAASGSSFKNEIKFEV